MKVRRDCKDNEEQQETPVHRASFHHHLGHPGTNARQWRPRNVRVWWEFNSWRRGWGGRRTRRVAWAKSLLVVSAAVSWIVVGVAHALEDLDSELKSHEAVLRAATDEVATARLVQGDHRLPITVGSDWIHGAAIEEVCSVHFQHVVNWQVLEHCNDTNRNFNWLQLWQTWFWNGLDQFHCLF